METGRVLQISGVALQIGEPEASAPGQFLVGHDADRSTNHLALSAQVGHLMLKLLRYRVDRKVPYVLLLRSVKH